MSKNKLYKFSIINGCANVYQNFDTQTVALVNHRGEVVSLKGNWAAGHFGNRQPIVLELACGGGEYTVGLGQHRADRNFIGVDIKGARIWKGATLAGDLGLGNVAFLRARIELIEHFFAAGEVSEVWITFPDPFPKESRANRRLTSPNFLERYRKMTALGCVFHLKTDDLALYRYTLGVIAEGGHRLVYHCEDIYAAPLAYPELALKTKYEHAHLAAGLTIKYIRFQLGQPSPSEAVVGSS